MREEEGRHTTTASRSYPLDSGGTLIDSPGVRDFAPAIEQLDSQTLGFPEVDRLAAGCRFQDCKHMQEPACAVMAAVEVGSVARRADTKVTGGCGAAMRISSKRAARSATAARPGQIRLSALLRRKRARVWYRYPRRHGRLKGS